MKFRILLITTLIISYLSSSAQERDASGFYYGDSPGETKPQYTLFSDNVKNKKFQDALPALEWLVANAPAVHKNLYINGVKTYADLEKNATDAPTKEKYQDKLLELYDLRLKHFGEEATVLQLKGGYAFNFLSKRKKYNELFELYKKIYELNTNQTSYSNLQYLMVSISALHKEKKFTDEQVLDWYDKISDVMDANIKTASAEDKPKWEAAAEGVSNTLSSTVKLDCDFVRNKMSATIKNNPADLKTAKRAIAYMIHGKCTEDPLYETAVNNVFTAEPSAPFGKVLYSFAIRNKNYDRALEYMKKTLDLTTENEKKADILLDMSDVLNFKGKKSEAREAAYDAVKADPAKSAKAYSAIGDLYYTSGSICSKTGNPVKDRAVYLAAYDMYAKAGDAKGMAKAKEQFPSKEDIFTYTMEEGQALEVGCWIGGMTTVRKR